MKNFILLSVLCTVCIVSCSRREKTWQLVWEDDFNRNDIFSTGVWTKMPRWHNADCCNTMSDDESLYEIKNGNLILLGKPNPTPAKDTAKYIRDTLQAGSHTRVMACHLASDTKQQLAYRGR